MPAIFVNTGKMEKEKKAELVREITESTSKATGLPKEAIVVYINEFDLESIGSGGVLVADKRKG